MAMFSQVYTRVLSLEIQLRHMQQQVVFPLEVMSMLISRLLLVITPIYQMETSIQVVFQYGVSPTLVLTIVHL